MPRGFLGLPIVLKLKFIQIEKGGDNKRSGDHTLAHNSPPHSSSPFSSVVTTWGATDVESIRGL